MVLCNKPWLNERRKGTRLVPWLNVYEQTGLSRTTVWRKVRANEFSSPIKISSGRVGWIAEEVDAWVQGQIDAATEHNPELRETFSK